jgi:eukaryotic-like serine/threonine-protein kinase
VLTLDGGVQIALGPALSKAGEGTIHEVVDRPEWVAKVFHSGLNDLAAKLDKVAAMIGSPPPGAIQHDAFVVLAWPMHLLESDRGAIGYVMPRIDTATAVEIHTLSNPSNRANPLPTAPQWPKNAAWHHLVNVAANLCFAVETVHSVDAVIGDFQERNILVSDTTRVTLVDCDSMQFTDPSGRQFLCGVGRPEFTAPELADVDLRSHPRSTPSDLFALAVHIHQLLMGGNHPFMRGVWTGKGEQPEALALAKAGHWAGGLSSQLHTHPLAPPIIFLPNEIQLLFTRAFSIGARNPAERPTAAEWRSALLGIGITKCPRQVHDIPAECAVCPWCDIDEERADRKRQRSSPSPPPAASAQVAWTASSTRSPSPAAAQAAAPKPSPPQAWQKLASSAPPKATSFDGVSAREVAQLASPGARAPLAALAVILAVVAIVVLVFYIKDGRLPFPRNTLASSSPSSPAAARGVPDVKGQASADAIGALQSRGFKTRTQQKPDSTVPPDHVIDTEPAGNVTALAGDEITLNVSTGPEQGDHPSLPDGAEICPREGGPAFRHSAVGPHTSCDFADSVRGTANTTALLEQGKPDTIDVLNTSWTTTISVTCAVEMVMTCRGGTNLVVYLY